MLIAYFYGINEIKFDKSTYLVLCFEFGGYFFTFSGSVNFSSIGTKS